MLPKRFLISHFLRPLSVPILYTVWGLGSPYPLAQCFPRADFSNTGLSSVLWKLTTSTSTKSSVLYILNLRFKYGVHVCYTPLFFISKYSRTNVVAREASAGRIPRGFDEGLAAYFERPVAARLARHAALVQNARAGGDLMSWSDLNRPAAPDIPPPVLMAHAYSMVAFLIDRHGQAVLGKFISALADEPDWRAVLRTTYSRAPNELEAQWEESLPRWTAGGWRTNLLAAFDLQPARELLELGHYATARRELEQSLRLFTDLGDDEGISEVGTLLGQTDTGLQAETFMSQAQAALEHHDYNRAQTLLQEARTQYDRLSAAQEPTELIAAYDELAQAGMQASLDLENARQQSLRWADYPMARASALAAGAGYARLGDDAGRGQTAEVLNALDSRQRRLVLLFGGLALLTAAWLTLWLWARGGTQLDWER